MQTGQTRRARGPFLESPETFSGPKEPFVKLRLTYSLKLVFSHVVKGWKIKITVKFRASRRLHFENTKRMMSPFLSGERCVTSRKTAAKETTFLEVAKNSIN